MRLNLYRMADSNRPEKLPLFKRRPVKMTLFALFSTTLLMAGMTGYLWRHAIGQELITLSVDSGLRLEKIIINGRVNTDEADITKAIDAEWYSPMLTLDLPRIHDSISTLGWVRGVEVKRKMPSQLVITIEERQALALFQSDAGHHVIDQDGAVIEGVEPEDFTHLPVIKGENAPQHASTILKILKNEPALYNDIWSLTYQSNRRWDVYLRNNIRIQLPELETELAW